MEGCWGTTLYCFPPLVLHLWLHCYLIVLVVLCRAVGRRLVGVKPNRKVLRGSREPHRFFEWLPFLEGDRWRTGLEVSLAENSVLRKI